MVFRLYGLIPILVKYTSMSFLFYSLRGITLVQTLQYETATSAFFFSFRTSQVLKFPLRLWKVNRTPSGTQLYTFLPYGAIIYDFNGLKNFRNVCKELNLTEIRPVLNFSCRDCTLYFFSHKTCYSVKAFLVHKS